MRGARRVGVEGGIERVAAMHWNGACSRRSLPRQALRPCHATCARRAARIALLLHMAELHLELLVAVLQLLNHPGELSDLAFQAVKPQHEVGRACLRGALRHHTLRRLRLHAALTREASAAAEDRIEQPGLLGALRARRSKMHLDSRNRHEGERRCPSQGGAGLARQGLSFRIKASMRG
jgi:hypothetical protein